MLENVKEIGLLHAAQMPENGDELQVPKREFLVVLLPAGLQQSRVEDAHIVRLRVPESQTQKVFVPVPDAF
jgi:hypothetical protein